MFEYIENGKVLYCHTFTPEIFFVTDEEGVVVSPIEVNLGRNMDYDFLSMTCDERGEPTPQSVKDKANESIRTYLRVVWDGKDIEYK